MLQFCAVYKMYLNLKEIKKKQFGLIGFSCGDLDLERIDSAFRIWKVACYSSKKQTIKCV